MHQILDLLVECVYFWLMKSLFSLEENQVIVD